ncbi:TPA: glutaminase A [Vibrio vulnificus]|nr:glutaminase A [Vibrio vulnificus]
MGALAIDDVLLNVYEQFLDNKEGKNAGYIPALAQADPEKLGIALCTRDGVLHKVGDSQSPFSIQSASKPFSFALALELVGQDEVFKIVGVEPSGDSFDAIRVPPPNPLVNVGALSVAGLLEQVYGDQAFDELKRGFSLFAGRDLEVDEEVMESELLTADRNRAICHLLAGSKFINNVDRTLELYTYGCSLLVDAESLAIMAATLAAGGTNPVTKEPIVERSVARNVLSLMLSCGMYDYAGRWIVDVGLPAKSAVSGGVMAAIPGQGGISVFSPRLDPRGNSVRGIEVCIELGKEFGLHVLGHEGASIIDSYLGR